MHSCAMTDRKKEEAEGKADQYPKVAEEEEGNHGLAHQLKNAQNCCVVHAHDQSSKQQDGDLAGTSARAESRSR